MTSLTLQITQASDNAYVRKSDNVLILDAGIQAGYFDADAYKFGCGLRYQNVTIPKGSIINSVRLSFKAYVSRNTVGVLTKIRVQLHDNPITFSTMADFDARIKSDDTILWDDIYEWIKDTWYDSPELKTLIQLIVNRVGWSSGNAIVLFWDDFDDRSTHNNNTIREAYQHFLGWVNTPKLIIDYTPSEPTLPPPVAGAFSVFNPVLFTTPQE